LHDGVEPHKSKAPHTTYIKACVPPPPPHFPSYHILQDQFTEPQTTKRNSILALPCQSTKTCAQHISMARREILGGLHLDQVVRGERRTTRRGEEGEPQLTGYDIVDKQRANVACRTAKTAKSVPAKMSIMISALRRYCDAPK
jgi:hypothetical protein